MKSLVRFGRRMPLPSTVQLLHEMRASFAEANVRSLCAEGEGLASGASWDEIARHRATSLKPV